MKGSEKWTAAEEQAILAYFRALKQRYGVQVQAPVKFTSSKRIYHAGLRQYVSKTGDWQIVKNRFVFGATLGHHIMKYGFTEYVTVRAQMPGVLPADKEVKGAEALYWIVTHEFAHLLQALDGCRYKGREVHGPEFVKWYRMLIAENPFHCVVHLFKGVGDLVGVMAVKPKPTVSAPQPVFSHAAGETAEITFQVNGKTYLRIKLADGSYKLQIVEGEKTP